jgi:hypothetical protein
MKRSIGVTLAAVVVTSVIAGCATPAEKVSPGRVNESLFTGYTCDQLHSEQKRLESSLVWHYRLQGQIRSSNVLSVILGLLPSPCLCGVDAKPEIARLKGELLCLQAEATRRGCPVPEVVDPNTGKLTAAGSSKR